MPIIKPTPPAEAITAFTHGLNAFLGGPDYGTGRTLLRQQFAGETPDIPTPADLGIPSGGLDSVPVQAFNPMPVFRLDLNNAVGGTLSSTVFAGWRFFAGSTETTSVLANVVRRPPTGRFRLTGVFFGARPGELLTASARLETTDIFVSLDFERRVLAIPAVNLEAFWLVPKTTSGGDLFVPVYPTSTDLPIPDLPETGAFSLPDFLGMIRPLARALAVDPPGAGR
jgi:hypothetical protein